MASQKKSRGMFCTMGLVEKMLRCAMGSMTPSEALKSSAYMNHAGGARKATEHLGDHIGHEHVPGHGPSMHWASAMAGFMQTAPPKTNSATVMPKDRS